MSDNVINKNAAPIVNSFAALQHSMMQWTNNTSFYLLAPSRYRDFYNRWVRMWLSWYDGYVPEIHSSGNGIPSTCIGTTIVNRLADSIIGGGIMFANSNPPVLRNEDGTSAALNFISDDWAKRINFSATVKEATRYTLAGGSALLKLNAGRDGLWVDTYRMDRFFADVAGNGEVMRCKTYINAYDRTVNGNTQHYYIVEERYYMDLPLKHDVPVVEYKIYSASGSINNTIDCTGTSITWEQLPREVKKSIKDDYADIRIGEPIKLPFDNLGCYLYKNTHGISNIPGIHFGESALQNILQYLLDWDYWHALFVGDMYLGRGRVMLPKAMQKNSRDGMNYNDGLDSFIYTKYESLSTDENKPVPIQFDLRTDGWNCIRNVMIQNIATAIGISIGTLASYLQDGSNRTAREVSAEENATTLFVEDKRRLYEYPLNELLKTVLRYYGYTDDVEIRWSKAGMTNISQLAEVLSTAVSAKLISNKKAHEMFNFDDDKSQIDADWEQIQAEQSEATAREQNSIFGNMDEGTEIL